MTAYADLGGLGPKQGPPVALFWKMPNLLPVLLPWLVVLALLALPSNRNARAWWIWASLGGMALLSTGFATAADASGNEGLSYSLNAVFAAACGLAAIWLLGAGLRRAWRALSIVLMTLAFAALSLLAFVANPVSEQMLELPYLAVFWIVSGLVIAGALNLAGWMCRRRFSGIRVPLLLLFCLWVMWLVGAGLVGGVTTLTSGGSFEWPELLLGTVALALVSLGLILPFLILSSTCAFYRERLKSLLRLPATDASRAAPASAPIAVPAGRQ